MTLTYSLLFICIILIAFQISFLYLKVYDASVVLKVVLIDYLINASVVVIIFLSGVNIFTVFSIFVWYAILNKMRLSVLLEYNYIALGSTLISLINSLIVLYVQLQYYSNQVESVAMFYILK